MKNRFFTRLISFVLSAVMIFSVIPLNIIAVDVGAESDSEANTGSVSVKILYNGAEERSVTLSEYDKLILDSRVQGTDSKNRTWQIMTPDGKTWVDIYGRTQESLPVAYSTVYSMLNERGAAYIRLAVSDGEALYVSEPTEIIMAYGEESATPVARAAAPRLASAGLMTAADEDFSTCTIVINYIFDNGGIAFESYGASVAYGSDFVRTVESPTVVGYEPFRRVGEDYVDASVVELNYTSITENITINVIYEPAIVEFQVHHHLQNLLDDDYSSEPDYITTYYGLTGSTVPNGLALTDSQLPGFKPLAYEKMTVAADGSTVVEIRYDRNYYLISFDMAGGFGVEPVYTRYGSSVGANSPTRHGYLFDGWELVSYGQSAPSESQKSMYDINSVLITLPDANLTYKARWITQLSEYTLVFWKENINDDGYTYWGYLDGLRAMSGSYVSGEDRIDEVAGIDEEKYFTYCDALTDKNVMVEGDGSTIVNVYYTRNKYKITFKAPGLCTIPEGHQHGDDCYRSVCESAHVHSDACVPVLTCETLAHEEHTSECVICGFSEHAHSSACCGTREHTHVKGCFNNVGASAKPSGAPTASLRSGYIYTTGSIINRKYYIYINGEWFSYTGRGASGGDIINPKCGYSAEHTHGSSNCACSEVEHTHGDTCYRDVLHTHDSNSCYSYSCGRAGHVHSAGCLVLDCQITAGHTHSSNCKKQNSTNVVKTVYKKYQESLEDIWPVVDGNGKTYNSGERWKPSDSTDFTQVLVYIANMPADDFTLTLDDSDNDTYTMNYYLEVLPGEEYTVTRNGRNYILYTTVKANYNYITRDEDFFDINGFVQLESNPKFDNSGQIDINGGGTVNFYYQRMVDHKLEFSSNGAVIDSKTVSGIQYGASLKDYNFVPPYPSSLEPNAYVFDGWYTSPGTYDGTEVDWETATMAAGGVLYYAKWSPIKHSVKVYLTDSLENQIGDVQYVNHNEFAQAPSGTVSNGNYMFQGWFYKDTVNGETVEKAFVFNGIPVLEDLEIYAKWSSHVSVSYTINYVSYLTKEKIADSTVGSAIAGHNKTFYAKAGEDLYVGFREGYYPLTSSHTVTMSAEADHEFTFEYVYVESMPYAVRYVDLDGNEVLAEKKVLDNNYSVVTETFVKLDKKMPDAYQKRLVLSASGEDADDDGILDENVITFYYNDDEEHAYYRVVHYIENLHGDGYREYRSEDAVGVIGDVCSVSAISLAGFSFNGLLTQINGVNVQTGGSSVSEILTGDGLLVEFYYDRVETEYIVNYLEEGSGKVLHTEKIGAGIFGEQIVEYAPGLEHLGYGLVSDPVKQIHLSTSLTANVINFYYQELVYSIKYQLVGPDGAGSLSLMSENVSAVSGEAEGSMPIVNNGYHFVGWYLDEACTKSVDAAIVNSETNSITPQKDGVWQHDMVYYAKIDPNFTTLTINTLGASDVDLNQAFLFRIKGKSGEALSVDITVAVVGNGSITVNTLPVGEYTVVEISAWSYRYGADNQEKSIILSVDAQKNTLTFSHIRVKTKWLDANSYGTHTFD